MPRLSLACDYEDGATPGRKHLLAVRWLHRHLEPRSMGRQAELGAAMAVSACNLTRELEELIAALDRRVPRVAHAGEAAIARDSAVLRAKAIGRLAELSKDLGEIT